MAKIGKVQEVAISKLKPYERNAKLHPQSQIDLIKKSIEEYGFISPCLIDKDFNIIAGHGRVEAAEQIGMETVPCLFIEGLTETQRKAYILTDNKLTELGGWDMDLVNEELEILKDENFDVTITGFEIEDIEPQVEDDNYEEPEYIEPRAKLGDIYQLGNHRLMCGDSTLIGNFNELMGGGFSRFGFY